MLEDTSDYAKIISFYIKKGGVGKSTHGYNFAGYCADVLNKRVLLIDGDHSRNMTNTFGVQATETIVDVFKHGSFPVYETNNPNIDIIPGDRLFTDEGAEIHKASTKYMEFARWIYNNKERIDKEYDFVIIDTHNDESFVTKNLLVASHLIVSPVTPDGDSYNGIDDLPEMIEKELKPRTIPFGANTSIVDLDIALIPNNVKINGFMLSNINKEFLDDLSGMENFIGVVPYRNELAESRLKNENIFVQFEKWPEKIKKKKVEFINHMKEIYAKVVVLSCLKAKESEG